MNETTGAQYYSILVATFIEEGTCSFNLGVHLFDNFAKVD